MSDNSLLCFALGLVAGAVVVTNNKKARELVEKGKKAVKNQVEKMK